MTATKHRATGHRWIVDDSFSNRQLRHSQRLSHVVVTSNANHDITTAGLCQAMRSSASRYKYNMLYCDTLVFKRSIID